MADSQISFDYVWVWVHFGLLACQDFGYFDVIQVGSSQIQLGLDLGSCSVELVSVSCWVSVIPRQKYSCVIFSSS